MFGTSPAGFASPKISAKKPAATQSPPQVSSKELQEFKQELAKQQQIMHKFEAGILKLQADNAKLAAENTALKVQSKRPSEQVYWTDRRLHVTGFKRADGGWDVEHEGKTYVLEPAPQFTPDTPRELEPVRPQSWYNVQPRSRLITNSVPYQPPLALPSSFSTGSMPSSVTAGMSGSS